VGTTLGAWSLLHCYPLPDGGLAIQWRDITAHKRTEEANRYLSNASDILNRSLEYEETLRELAQLVVPELADWCAVDILGERGMLERVAVAHVDPERDQRQEGEQVSRGPDHAAPPIVVSVARASGEYWIEKCGLMRRASDSRRRASARSPSSSWIIPAWKANNALR